MEFRHLQGMAIIWLFGLLFLTSSGTSTVTFFDSMTVTPTFTCFIPVSFDSSMTSAPPAGTPRICTQNIENLEITLTSISFEEMSVELISSTDIIKSTVLSTQNAERTFYPDGPVSVSTSALLIIWTTQKASSPTSTDKTLQSTLDTEIFSTITALAYNYETSACWTLSPFTNTINTSESRARYALVEAETTSSQYNESFEARRTSFYYTAITYWEGTLLLISSMPSPETEISFKEETQSTTEPVANVPLISITSIIIPTKSSTAITPTTPVSLVITEIMLPFPTDTSISSTTISAKVTSSTTENATTAHITTLRTTESTLTTMKPDNYRVGRDEINITLNINVVVVANYTKELEDHTSSLFLSYQLNFTISLREVYRILEGFMGVNVSGFREGASNTTNNNRGSRTGNIIVDHEVILSGKAADNKTMDKMQEIIDKNITQGELAGFSVNKNATLTEVARNIAKFRSEINNLCLLTKHPCSNGYYCNSDNDGVVCRSLCGLPGWEKCTIHGQCQPATYENTTECRCFEDDDYLYRGRYCEEKTEKLKSDTKYTIAVIAGVSVGSLVILFVLVTIVICILRRRKETELTSEQLAIPMWIRAMEKTLALSRPERPKIGHEQNKRRTEKTYDEIPADKINRLLPLVRLHGNLRDDPGYTDLFDSGYADGHRLEDSGYTDLVDRGYMDLNDTGGYETPREPSYIQAIFDGKERSAYGSSPVQYESGDDTYYNIYSKPPAGVRKQEHSFENRSINEHTRYGYMRRDYRTDKRNQY